MIQHYHQNRALWLYSIAILIIASLTYGFEYYTPTAVFWDENYHIASAQKYIEGIMYMEPHPPLGKLFIALGEYILNPNENLNISHFVATDYIKHFPKGYSFSGVRLFPTLFGIGSAVLFFFILYRLTTYRLLSFLFSSLYLFANAYILQSRSAMLESTQMFFIFATILYFVHLVDKDKIRFKEYLIFGAFIGLAVAVKLNGLILTLLYPFLFLYRTNSSVFILEKIRLFIIDGFAVVLGIVIVLCSVFYIHFSLGNTLGVKKYKASPEYLQIIKEKATANPLNFSTMMTDHFFYIKDYSKGVPRYNPCKKGENGSLATTWPFGNKSINYRWAKKDGKVRYLYLQSNPIIWFSVLFSILLAVSLIVSKFIFNLHVKDKRLFFLISVFTSMYLSYIFTMFNIDRVMYLYHYFVPLFFGSFVLVLLFSYIFKESLQRESNVLYAALILFAIEIAATYFFFMPLTYYMPLTTMEFLQREWFDFWKLQPIL
jgi:dolichyl-phosphate-mannose--protein O-mannosyl transferase